jgi:hypothetical protein
MHADVASSGLAGAVRDSSGGAVADATVAARQEPGGLSARTVSDAEGRFRFANLVPGRYTVSVEKAGFRTAYSENVILAIDHRADLDFVLEPGQPHETVTVTAAVSPMDISDGTLGYRLENSTITGLPLLGRNMISLVTLGPGAIPRQLGGFVHDVVNDVQANRGAVALNPPVHGARSTMNVFLLDGAYNTDRNTFSAAVNAPLEAVSGFRIQSSAGLAEFPQAGGAVADVVTKNGGGDFHGGVFEFFRNEATDARNFFDDPSLPRPIFRRNQFGGSLGGPLPARGAYFFGTYEGVRGKAAKSSLNLVPDAVLRSGNFSGGAAIFDPLSLDPAGARLPFAGNAIPASRIDPIARNYLDRYQPLPNRSGGGPNYLDATPSESREDHGSMRLDYETGPGSRLFGRYTINDERTRIAGVFPLLPTSERLRAQQAVIAHTLARGSWVNEGRFSFTRLRVFSVSESAFGRNIAGELGITGIPDDPFTYGLPFFLVTNFSMRTDDPILPQVQRDNQWHFSDGFSISHGRHTAKTGFQWIHGAVNYRQSHFARGQYIFTGALTANPAAADPGGDPFADFLLGFPQVTNREVGAAQAYLRQNSYAGYMQDEWRASARVTLNFGLRYEYTAPYSEARGNLLNLDYSRLPAPPRLVARDSAARPDRNDFAPRVGMAARLPWRSVFRAGYGVFYSPEIATETYDLVRNGVRTENNQTDGSRPILTIRNGFPQTGDTGLPSYFGLDPGVRTPYMQQWNAGFQRELPGGAVAEVSYVGSKGTHLGRFRTFNTPLHVETGENLAPRPGDLQALRTFPEIGRIIQRQHIANSSYHALEVRVEKRFAGRLGLLASFSWAKSIDDADGIIPGQFDGFGAQDERNLRLERGLSFFDVRRRISAGAVYRLPWRFQMSGILTLQDGTPLNPVYFAYDGANSGTPNRPDVVPGVDVRLPRDQRSADRFFNADAFQQPKPFTFGNAGRNIIPGPGNAVLDLGIHRDFRVTEKLRAQLRAESFNLLNHPNFGIPGPYPDFGPFFGRIFSTGDPRRFQWGLRFDW